MATALANNLSLAFQSSQWDAWKIEDSTRMFKLLGVHCYFLSTTLYLTFLVAFEA